MRSAARLAELAIPALRGDDAAWKKLLAEEPDRDANIAEIAARTLVAKDDTRGIQVLVRLIVEDRRYPRYGGEILRLGQAAVEPLERIRADSDDLRIRLLCESLALRIQRPDLAARYDKAITFRTRGFMNRRGPGLDDYRASGRQVAALLQEDGAEGAAAIPLLEAELMFGSSHGHPGVAAFALAVFKQDRSFDLLVELLEQKPPQAHALPLLAEALRDFGERGIEKLKTISVPQAELPAFGTRARQFRAATDALVEEDPKVALENVLAGLKALDSDQAADDPQWTTSAARLLQTAARFDDPRLVDSVLAVWKRRKIELRFHTFQILKNYDHPAIADAALEALALEPMKSYAYANFAEEVALLHQLQDRTAERLIEELVGAATAERRTSAARTLMKLSTVGLIGNVVRADETEWKAMQSKMAQAARKPLVEALDDPEVAVRRAAAEALAALVNQYDEPARNETASRLVHWMKTSRQWPVQVAGPLAASGQADVIDALLEAYRASDHSDLELAEAISQSNDQRAAAELLIGLRKFLQRDPKGYPPQIRLLAVRPAGLERLRSIVTDGEFPLSTRLVAAKWLGTARSAAGFDRAAAFDDVLGLREELESGEQLPWAQSTIVETLPRLDPQRAYPLLARWSATETDPRLRATILSLMQRLESAHPDLKRQPIRLRPE